MINKLEDNKRKKLIIGGSIVIITIVAIYGYFKYSELYPSTDDAYVGASLINVAPKVSGYLSKLYVSNNQNIKKGDTLFTIDPIDYQLAYEQAQKNYQSQIDTVIMAEKQLDVQQEQIKKEKQQYTYVKQLAERYTALYKANTVSQQDYQKAVTDYAAIKAQVAMDTIRYKQYLQACQYTKSKMGVAQAQLDAAKENLSYTKYVAPASGYVTNMNNLSAGEFLGAGQQVFGVVDDQSWWVDANFKETQLARIKPGQTASVVLDMYQHTYTGVVQSVSYASGGTFSLLPAQNATGNWVKVTQRFTVRIKIKNDPKFPLRVGASAYITINTI